jgi:hypothetical protein
MTRGVVNDQMLEGGKRVLFEPSASGSPPKPTTIGSAAHRGGHARHGPVQAGVRSNGIGLGWHPGP